MGATVALVVGAGEGLRFGGDVPKQYRQCAGHAVMWRSLSAFLNHPEVASVQAVIHPSHHGLYDEAVRGLPLPAPVDGGATRQDSVARGLESLAAQAPSRVLIHDAARPLVDHGVISRVLAALETSPGAVPALAVADTLKRGAGGFVVTTVDRRDLWQAQTPQVFRRELLLDAFARRGELQPTDEAQLVEQLGHPVRVVEGSPMNFKITTAADFKMAEAVIKALPKPKLLQSLHPFADEEPRLL